MRGRADGHVVGCRQRRDLGARAVGVEAPAVIAAPQAVAVDVAGRQGREAVRAPVGERGERGSRRRRSGSRTSAHASPSSRTLHRVAADLGARAPPRATRGAARRAVFDSHHGHLEQLFVERRDLDVERGVQRGLVDVVEPRGVDAVADELLGDIGRVLVLPDEVDVLLADVGVEHRRVVGVEVHEQARRHHLVDRVRREVGPAVHDRGGGRTAREVDALVAATRDHCVVLEDVVAVVDALAAEHVEARRDVLRRAVLGRVAGAVQPGVARQLEALGEFLGRVGRFRRVHAEPDQLVRRLAMTSSVICVAISTVSWR